MRVSVSVVPVSAAEAIRMRTEFERDPSDGKEYAQAVFGPDSWSHRPKFAESALGFRSSGRLILMRQEERFLDDYAQLESIARSINALPGGIRPEPAVVEQPDCALGTGAAAQVLGTKVTMQRGGTAGTASFCGWGSSQATIVLHAGKSGSEPAQRFGSDVHRDAVDVGDGGHLSKPGLLEFRVGTTFVQIFGPTTKGLVELGRVMAPVYRG
ncbi:hypothetical protein HPO96_34320 [Kribbella sandramycini]|uniref:Uncharacterized protein n=1 Tax=Kribbella sandramycini TaxID=60450 RepID=A0A7Y4L6N3_9ACTN|nr:hypothetical protein [Kribbella sandramycini]MBB6570477.1 hypothetical protein [Kribbella sandramycini]NOL45337.1 hypothetical protein [Kribbella sandramycini]